MLGAFYRMSAPAQPKTGLLALAWPIFIEQGLRILIGIVDTLMVSHVSSGAVAGLGVANQLVIIFLIFFNFIAIGSGVVVTHHLGAGHPAGANRITTTAIAACTWLGLAASLAVWLWAAPMLRLMQLPDHLMEHALPFLTLMGGTLFMEAMNMAIAATLRAHKHTRDTMIVLGGQNLLNVAGNCVLLFGLFGAPKMGVTGVALSSVFSRACACVALWILLDRRTRLRLRMRDFLDLAWVRLRPILRIGLPAAGENLCYWTALLTVTSFVARMGEHPLATHTLAQNLQRLVILFSLSLGLGTEILVGHLVGAGRLDDAYHALLRSLRTGVFVALGLVLVVAACSPWLLRLFADDPEIIAGGAGLMLVSVLIEPGRVFNIVVISSLRATGDVWYPIAVGACSMWGVWVPLAWLLGLHTPLGVAGIWLAMAADEWLRGVLMQRRWKQRRWMQAAVRARAHAIPGPDPTAV
jgi:putative MATE family efflux protein